MPAYFVHFYFCITDVSFAPNSGWDMLVYALECGPQPASFDDAPPPQSVLYYENAFPASGMQFEQISQTARVRAVLPFGSGFDCMICHSDFDSCELRAMVSDLFEHVRSIVTAGATIR